MTDGAPEPTGASTGPRVLGNFLYLLLAQVISAAAGVVSTAFLARKLGTDAYGILGFGTAILSYFGLLVALGTDVYGMREMAQDRRRIGWLVPRILGLRLTLLGVVSIAYVIVVARLGQPEEVRIVLVIQGLGLFVTAFTLDFVFQAIQRMGVIAIRQVMAAGLVLVAVVVLIHSARDIYIAAAIPPVALALSAAWLASRLRREAISFAIEFDPATWRLMLRAAIPIAVAQLMNSLFFNIDIVMLGFMASSHQLGLYVAMSRLLQIAIVFGGLIVGALAPVLAAAWPQEAQMRARYRDFVAAAMLFGAPIAALGIAYPVEIIRVVFGDGFVGAAPVLQLHMATAAIAYAGLAAGTALVAWHDQTAHMVVQGVGGISNVLFNLVLIPRYGIQGAAVATLMSQILIFLGLGGRALVRFRMVALVPALRLVAVAGVAFAAIRLADAALGHPPVPGPAVVGFLVRAAAGGALYVALAWLVGGAQLRRPVEFLFARFRARPPG